MVLHLPAFQSTSNPQGSCQLTNIKHFLRERRTPAPFPSIHPSILIPFWEGLSPADSCRSNQNSTGRTCKENQPFPHRNFTKRSILRTEALRKRPLRPEPSTINSSCPWRPCIATGIIRYFVFFFADWLHFLWTFYPTGGGLRPS